MAGLHLHRSNHLEVLVEILAAQLRGVPPDPFEEVEIVVGSRGMERHLRHALAERLGICARIAFPFPAAALDAAIPAAEPSSPEGPDPWSPAVLVWALLEVLPTVAEDPTATSLRRYLEAGGSPAGGWVAVDARAHGLAARVATLFDRYVTYRPEVAIRWSAGADDGLEQMPGQAWQPRLWRAVQAQLGQAPHRAERLVAAFAEGTPPIGAAPLRIFGLSNLPGSWLEALARLSRTRDVELYLLSPSQEYWADLARRLVTTPPLGEVPRDEVDAHLRTGTEEDRLGEAGHPLLVSWGRVARDAQILLTSLPEGFDDTFHDVFLDPRRAEGPPTALHLLQDDLLHAVHPSLREDFDERRFDPDDRTVQIHACHGATRQVEVLRDVLLGLLDEDPSLHPRDIVVMTPDIEAYAPLIAAVFDQGERHVGAGGVPRIPWEIADLTVRRLNPVADALLRVLDLVDGRAGAQEILDLLTLEPVAERFGLGPEEVATLRSWVVESGVRWGADAAHRAAHQQPADDQNTWRFGLDRLLLGVVLPDEGGRVAGVRPFDGLEGSETRLLGPFADFCAALFEAVDSLRAPRTVVRWARDLGAVVSLLTRTSGQAEWLTRRVREALAALEAAGERAGNTCEVGVEGIRAALAGGFDVASAASHGSGGAVTFCGMVPERAVPYRVVCLLGMCEGAFPRSGGRTAFDLTLHPPRVGDRDPRDEDRYLVLEAVLSARERLVVLYTGRDLRTNEVRPPAVPVSELCDALDATWPEGSVRPSAALTVYHPLQAFDPRNFGAPGGPAGEGPWSFDRRLLAGARAALQERREPPGFLDLREAAPPWPLRAEGALSLQELLRFWRHPIRTFLRQRMRLWLPYDGEARIPDREPIELGWGSLRGLFEEVLAVRAGGGSEGEVRARLRGAGVLPLGQAGEVAFRAVVDLAGAVEDCAEAICVGPLSSTHGVDVDLRLEGERLVGRVEGCADGTLVVVSYGKEGCDDLLAAWIRLLAWRAQEPAAPARALLVFGRVDTKGRPAVECVGLEVEEEQEALATLVRLRAEGVEGPLPFFPKTSHAFARAALASKGGLPGLWRDTERLATAPWDDELAGVFAGALGKAEAAWVGGFSRGEAEERYHHHAFGGALPFLHPDGSLDRTFVSLALGVWGPVLEARRTASVVKAWGGGR